MAGDRRRLTIGRRLGILNSHSPTYCSVFLKGCSNGRLWKIVSFTFGGTVALCMGLLTSVYLATLHENDLWFSNIKVRDFCACCVTSDSAVLPVVKQMRDYHLVLLLQVISRLCSFYHQVCVFCFSWTYSDYRTVTLNYRLFFFSKLDYEIVAMNVS